MSEQKQVGVEEQQKRTDQIVRYCLDEHKEPSEGTGWLIEKGSMALGVVDNRPAWVSYLHPGVIRFARERDAVGMLWSLRSYGDSGFTKCYVSEHAWGHPSQPEPPSAELLRAARAVVDYWIKGGYQPGIEHSLIDAVVRAESARPRMPEVGDRIAYELYPGSNCMTTGTVLPQQPGAMLYATNEAQPPEQRVILANTRWWSLQPTSESAGPVRTYGDGVKDSLAVIEKHKAHQDCSTKYVQGFSDLRDMLLDRLRALLPEGENAHG